MTELVSIITPTYNSAKFMEETVQSVLNQTYQNWEWVITDDGSSDETTKMINQYKDDRIKLQVLPKNGGAGNARNKSLERAKGRYIAFLDSDDYWFPDYLEKMLNFLEINNFELVYSNYSRCNEQLEPVIKDFSANKIVTFSTLLKTCTLAPVSTIYDSKRVGKEYFPVKSKREDHVMWLNLLKKIPKAQPLNQTLAKYRMVENSVSRKKTNIMYDQYLVYKNFMKFSTLKSLYYTANWAMNGFLKYSKFFN